MSVREYAKAANTDWEAAKAAAGKPGLGTVAIYAPSGAVAYMHWGDVENQFGQRIDTHQYPILGGYWQQPLSEDVNRFSLTGWIAGRDYLALRDQLSLVLHTQHDSENPLVLDLPTYEPIGVLFRSGSQKESGKRGGMVELSLQFERVLNVKPTVAVVDAAAIRDRAKEGLLASLCGDLEGLASKVDGAWKEGSNKAVAVLAQAKAAMQLAQGTAADLGRGIWELQNGIEQALLAPGEVVNSLGALVSSLVVAVLGTGHSGDSEARRLQRYFASWAALRPTSEAASFREWQIQNTSYNMIKALGAIGVAEVLPSIQPSSIDDARSMYVWLEHFEHELEQASASLLVALEGLRLAVREELRSLGWFGLARQKSYRLDGAGLPSIALAQILGTDEKSLRKLNNVQNAFFVHGVIRYV